MYAHFAHDGLDDAAAAAAGEVLEEKSSYPIMELLGLLLRHKIAPDTPCSVPLVEGSVYCFVWQQDFRAVPNFFEVIEVAEGMAAAVMSAVVSVA